jgi:hypothetical protein
VRCPDGRSSGDAGGSVGGVMRRWCGSGYHCGVRCGDGRGGSESGRSRSDCLGRRSGGCYDVRGAVVGEFDWFLCGYRHDGYR